MALQLRRGTEAQRASSGITPASGELLYCTDSRAVYSGDGATRGGNAMPAAIGQQPVAAPEADGVLALAPAAIEWAVGLSLGDLGDVEGTAYDGDLVVWDAAGGTYRPGLPNAAHRPIIVAAQDAALPTTARPGTLWTRGPLSDGLYVCTAAGPPATWELLAFAVDQDVAGAALTAAAALMAGAAAAGVDAAGVSLAVTASFSAGVVSGTGVEAPGAALAAMATLSPGAAAAGAGISGFSMVATASFSPGAIPVDGAAGGFSITATASFSAGAGSGAASDPHFANVALLLHMNGSDGSTTFTDSSSFARTVTASNCQISTAQSKFGGASGLIGSTTGSDLAVGPIALAGDFTIECFAWHATWEGNAVIVGSDNTSTYGLRFYYSSGAYRVSFVVGTTYPFVHTLPLSTWAHVAWVRSGSTNTLYLNGVSTGTFSYSGTFNLNRIGSRYAVPTSYQFNGYLDEFRVTDGVARYTSNFTPPSAPYPDS